MPEREFRGARSIAALGWGLTITAIVSLIAVSIAGRSQRVETPKWDAARFALIRSGAGITGETAALCCAPVPHDTTHAAVPAPAALAAPAAVSALAPAAVPAHELWIVAVYPGCPHCRASLASVMDRARPLGARVHVAALLVDAPVRPDSGAIAGLAAQVIYWDSAGVWRHRWGRKAYGETIVFDSLGTLARIASIEP